MHAGTHQNASENHTVDSHELVTKQRGITQHFVKDNIDLVTETIRQLVTKVYELLQLKIQGLEERLNQIVAKQEFDTAQEHATAEPPTQQHNAYAEHELRMQLDKTI